MDDQNARFSSTRCRFYIHGRRFLQGFSHLHRQLSEDPEILVILMKILWKILDLHLLFVRYSFIMNGRLILEESVRG